MTELDTQPVGRPGRRCVVCSSSDRSAIEEELTSGEFSIRGIAGRWGLAPESVRRHTRAHLDPALIEAMLAVRGIPALNVLARLMELADDARDLRLHAEEKGDDRLLIQAHRAEERTLAFLADKLGVTKLPTDDMGRVLRESLDEAMGMIRVVARVARDHPRVGDLMGDHFDRLGLSDLAARVREQAAHGRAPIHETKGIEL